MSEVWSAQTEREENAEIITYIELPENDLDGQRVTEWIKDIAERMGAVVHPLSQAGKVPFPQRNSEPRIENGRCVLCCIPCKAGVLHMNCPKVPT